MAKRRSKEKKRTKTTPSSGTRRGNYLMRLFWYFTKAMMVFVPIGLLVALVVWVIVELLNPPLVVINVIPSEAEMGAWGESGSYFVADKFQDRWRKIRPASLTVSLQGESAGFAPADGKTKRFKWFGGANRTSSIVCLQVLGRCQIEEEKVTPQVLLHGPEQTRKWVDFEEYLTQLIKTSIEHNGEKRNQRRQLFVFCDVDELDSISSLPTQNLNFSYAVQEMWQSKRQELCAKFDVYLTLSHDAGQRSLLTLQQKGDQQASERISYFLHRLEEAILAQSDVIPELSNDYVTYGDIKSYLSSSLKEDSQILGNIQTPVFLKPEGADADKFQICRRHNREGARLFERRPLDVALGESISILWEYLKVPDSSNGFKVDVWLTKHHPDWLQQANHLLVRLEQLWLQCHSEDSPEVGVCLRQFDDLKKMIKAEREALRQYVFASKSKENNKATSLYDSGTVNPSSKIDLGLLSEPAEVAIKKLVGAGGESAPGNSTSGNSAPGASAEKDDGKSGDDATGDSTDKPASGSQVDPEKLKQLQNKIKLELEKVIDGRAGVWMVWRAVTDPENNEFLTRYAFNTLIKELKDNEAAWVPGPFQALHWSEVAYLIRIQKDWSWELLDMEEMRNSAQQALGYSLRCRDISNRVFANLDHQLLHVFERELLKLEQERRQYEDLLFASQGDMAPLVKSFKELYEKYDRLEKEHRDFSRDLIVQRTHLLLVPHYLRYVTGNLNLIQLSPHKGTPDADLTKTDQNTENEPQEAAQDGQKTSGIVVAEKQITAKDTFGKLESSLLVLVNRWEQLTARPEFKESAAETYKSFTRLMEEFKNAQATVDDVFENSAQFGVPKLDLAYAQGDRDNPDANQNARDTMLSARLLEWPGLDMEQIKQARKDVQFGEFPLETVSNRTSAFANGQSDGSDSEVASENQGLQFLKSIQNNSVFIDAFSKKVTFDSEGPVSALFENTASFHFNDLKEGVRIARLDEGQDPYIKMAKVQSNAVDDLRVNRILMDFWAIPKVNDNFYFQDAAKRALGPADRPVRDRAQLENRLEVIDDLKEFADRFEKSNSENVALNWKLDPQRGEGDEARDFNLEFGGDEQSKKLPQPLDNELKESGTIARITVFNDNLFEKPDDTNEQFEQRMLWPSWRYGAQALDDWRSKRKKWVEIRFRGHTAYCKLAELPPPPPPGTSVPIVKSSATTNFRFNTDVNSNVQVLRRDPAERYHIILLLDCSRSMLSYSPKILKRAEGNPDAQDENQVRIDVLRKQTNAFLKRLAGQRSAKVRVLAIGASHAFKRDPAKPGNIDASRLDDPDVKSYEHWAPPPTDENAVKPFKNYVRLSEHLKPSSKVKILSDANIDWMTQAISELEPHGQTPLFYGINKAAELFPEKNDKVENLLVVISDGMDYTTDGLVVEGQSFADPEANLREVFRSKGIKVHYFNFGSREFHVKELEDFSAKEQMLNNFDVMNRMASNYGTATSLGDSSLREFLLQIAPETSAKISTARNQELAEARVFDKYVGDEEPNLDFLVLADDDFNADQVVEIRRGGKKISQSIPFRLTRGQNLKFFFNEKQAHEGQLGTNRLEPFFGDEIPWETTTGDKEWLAPDNKKVNVHLREENGTGNFYLDFWSKNHVTPAPARLFLRVKQGDDSFLLQDYQATLPFVLDSYNLFSFNVVPMGEALPKRRYKWKGPVQVELHLVPKINWSEPLSFRAIPAKSMQDADKSFDVGNLKVTKYFSESKGRLDVTFEVQATDKSTKLDNLIIQPFFRPTKDEDYAPRHDWLGRFMTQVDRKYAFENDKLVQINHKFSFYRLLDDENRNEIETNLRFMVMDVENFQKLPGATVIPFPNNTDWER